MPEPFTDRKRLFTGPRVSLFRSFSSSGGSAAHISGNNNPRASCSIFVAGQYAAAVGDPEKAPMRARARTRVRASACVRPCAKAPKSRAALPVRRRQQRCWPQLHPTALEQRRAPSSCQTIIVAAEAQRANDYALILIS